MTNRDYKEELEYLKGYNATEEEKIKFIENLYILINMNFSNFTKKNGHILI